MKLIEFSNEPIWHVKERRGIRNDFKILVLSVLQVSVCLCPRAFPERLKKKKKSHPENFNLRPGVPEIKLHYKSSLESVYK